MQELIAFYRMNLTNRDRSSGGPTLRSGSWRRSWELLSKLSTPIQVTQSLSHKSRWRCLISPRRMKTSITWSFCTSWRRQSSLTLMLVESTFFDSIHNSTTNSLYFPQRSSRSLIKLSTKCTRKLSENKKMSGLFKWEFTTWNDRAKWGSLTQEISTS